MSDKRFHVILCASQNDGFRRMAELRKSGKIPGNETVTLVSSLYATEAVKLHMYAAVVHSTEAFDSSPDVLEIRQALGLNMRNTTGREIMFVNANGILYPATNATASWQSIGRNGMGRGDGWSTTVTVELAYGLTVTLIARKVQQQSDTNGCIGLCMARLIDAKESHR